MTDIKRDVITLDPRVDKGKEVKEAFLMIVDDMWLDKQGMYKKTVVKNGKPNLRNLLALCDLHNLEFNCDFANNKLVIKYYCKEKQDKLQEKKLEGIREEKSNSEPTPEDNAIGTSESGTGDKKPAAKKTTKKESTTPEPPSKDDDNDDDPF